MACSKANRNPDEISIVAVTKNRTSQEIKEAIAAGIGDIGENRVQEALGKYNDITSQGIKWHMVGHLQTNKAKEAVNIFDLIHSVDSLRLALEIDKRATKINKIQDVLIEIKTSSEATKFGLIPEDALEAIRGISRLGHIAIKGLMTIAPIAGSPQEARPYFRRLRELRDEINQLLAPGCQLQILSMGMTDDFEAAIEEGSNMIRLGRAIFEG